MDSSFLTSLSSLMALLVAAGSMYIALKKAPVDTENTRVDTATKYQLIADAAAERALKLDKRVMELEQKVDEQDAKIEKQDKEIVQYQREIADLRDWAERLVHQLLSENITPVKIRVRTNE
jgi:peptidoglycan hydrolase CwlO-like protein